MLLSKNDKRTYLPYSLPNGMEVLIVQDNQCKKTAVSLCVATGHFNDPIHIEGLGHLLEHMLFLGSERYPEANGFNQFLSTHGGNLNAWTGTEHSNFHFEVPSVHFAASIDHFYDMIHAPLLDLGLIDKEIQSIDAEFELKQKDDLRRLYQVHKETCNPAHPFSKFSVGNAQTLRSVDIEELKKQLIELHQQNFVPENFRLCVISDMPTVDVKPHLDATFGKIPKVSSNCAKTLPPLYLPEHLGVQINIKPIKVARRLIISFALPDTQQYFRTKPLDLISHLLGDEGAGSLLAYFKQQGWATNLSAGGGINGSNFKDFNLNLQLTEAGLDNIEAILNSVFYLLELIKQDLDSTWRLKEKAQLGVLAFDYSDGIKPIDDAIGLANQMFHYPTEYLLCSEFIIDQFAQQPLQDCLTYMHPKNMRLKVISPDLKTDRIAKWYQTPYSIFDIDLALLERLQTPVTVDYLALPKPNPYIVGNTQIQAISDELVVPQKIIDVPDCNIWFAQDDQFGLPKGECFLSFDCAAVVEGAEVSAYKRLWVALMMEHFSNQYYQAGVAGLHHHLYPHQAGFSLHTSGFSQKQMTLCKELFQQIHEKQHFSDLFEQTRIKHFHALQNALLNKPINRLFTRLSGIVQRYTHAPSELLPFVEHASIDHIDSIQQKLLSNYFLESFIYGDWNLSQAQDLSAYLVSHEARSKQGKKIKRDVVDLRTKAQYLHQVESQHQDSAAVLYFQTPSTDVKDVALTILIEQLFATPFFHTLRTEKQLGYLVGSGYLPLNQHPGMAFYIQSPNYNAQQLVVEIEGYLHELMETIDDFAPFWHHVRASVIKQLTDNDTNLSVKSQRLWMAIGNDDSNFNQQDMLADALKNLTFDDVKCFCGAMSEGNTFGKLILFCTGKFVNSRPDKGTEIHDLHQFKQTASYMI